MFGLRNVMLVAAALLAGPAAYAEGDVGDFNFNETTGLINIPSARVAPTGSFQISPQMASIKRVSNGTKNNGFQGWDHAIDDDSLFGSDSSFRGICGVARNLEISAMALQGNIRNIVYGAKWLAVEDAVDHPAFAIGVQSIGAFSRGNYPGPNTHPPNFDQACFFGVLGHYWSLGDDGLGVEFHGGWGTGRLNKGFVGSEFHFNNQVSLIAEYDGTIESVGLRVTPHPRWEIMPVVQFNSNSQVHVGLSLGYRFGNSGEDELRPGELRKKASSKDLPEQSKDQSPPSKDLPQSPAPQKELQPSPEQPEQR